MHFNNDVLKFYSSLNLVIEKIDNQKKWIFLVASILNGSFLLTFDFIPSLDGPQHLYVSNIIVNLIKSNELVNQFFKFNDVIVGNWIGHFILSFYHLFFSAAISEKLLLATYYLGIAYSFRYLVISIKGKATFLSFIIFPFSTTTLVLYGYYNFSLAVIVFFFVMGFWIRMEQKELSRKMFFSMMFLFLLLFLSHVFVFMLTGLVFAIHLFLVFLNDYFISNNRVNTVRYHLKKFAFLFIAAIPAIILWINYTIVVTSLGYEEVSKFSFFDLTNFLVTIRSLMAFHKENETPGNVALFIFINLIIAFSIIFRFVIFKRNRRNPEKVAKYFRTSDFWLVVSFVFLILYYVVPDRMSSGNITNRISIIMFFILIIWIAIQDVPKWFGVISAILFVTITINNRSINYNNLSLLERNIIDLKTLDKHIDDDSVIVTIGKSKNWAKRHFPFYLGVDKSVVFLTNPQLGGQFPVIWNLEEIPPVFLGNKNINKYEISNFHGITGDNYIDHKIRFADYALIIEPNEYFKNGLNKTLINTLEKYYVKVAKVRSNYALYKFNLYPFINRWVKNTRNSEYWTEVEKKKAAENGFSLDNMLLIDALYIYNKKQ